MLRRTGAGAGTLGLAAVLADGGMLAPGRASAAAVSPLAPKKPHFEPRAKRLIYLHMNGGPSHIDTFDYKPALEKYDGQRPPQAELKTLAETGDLMKSPFKFRQWGESGHWVSELFPHTACCIDDICVIKSMVTDVPEHAAGLLLMNLGTIQPNRPSLGAWLGYGLGTENQNLPSYLVLCPNGESRPGANLWGNSFLPGIHAGCYVDSFNLDARQALQDIENRYLSRADQRRQLELLSRMNQLHLERMEHDAALEARIQSLELAFRMQSEVPDAFDLSKETQATRDMYGIGEKSIRIEHEKRPFGGFAEGCLLARRLSERGVRMVQLSFAPDIPWDDHFDIMNHQPKARDCDQAIAALLKDLKQRGLLEETLVMWGGEFGRTPVCELRKASTAGRDHNHYGFTVWLAGGGVRAGMSYGATDELGFQAVENRVHVHDLHATILHLMGIDHERLTYRHSGRDFRLTDVYGNVVRDILA